MRISLYGSTAVSFYRCIISIFEWGTIPSKAEETKNNFAENGEMVPCIKGLRRGCTSYRSIAVLSNAMCTLLLYALCIFGGKPPGS